MAFIHSPTSSIFRRQWSCLSSHRVCRQKRNGTTRRQPTMMDQNAVAIVATMVAGIGGGIALVAWTENQGKRTELRANIQPCAECGGETTTVCNVCNGSTKDPLDASKLCSYCEGNGSIKCFNCSGSGIQPRFLDRLSPEDFMD